MSNVIAHLLAVGDALRDAFREPVRRAERFAQSERDAFADSYDERYADAERDGDALPAADPYTLGFLAGYNAHANNQPPDPDAAANRHSGRDAGDR